MLDTAFSSIVFSSAPFTSSLVTILANGSIASTCPRVIKYGGGVYGGQKSLELSVVGHVRSARMPPELVMAKSVAAADRIASAVTSPTSDSHSRPSRRPQASA